MPKKLVIKGRFRIILNQDKLLENKEFDRFRTKLLETINNIAIGESQGFWIPEMYQKLEIFKSSARANKFFKLENESINIWDS